MSVWGCGVCLEQNLLLRDPTNTHTHAHTHEPGLPRYRHDCRMASRAQRVNGSRDRICHFKLVLLGKIRPHILHDTVSMYVREGFSVCSAGESGVGKSCLVLRFVKGEYSDHLEATIGGN